MNFDIRMVANRKMKDEEIVYFDTSAVITDFTCVLNAILCNSEKNNS